MSTRTQASCQESGRRGGLASARRRLKVRRLRKLDPALSPTIRATAHDIIFAAGFYEGDGSCYHRGHSMGVTITQKDRGILDWLRSRFGGNVYKQRGPARTLFQWQISGARARGFVQSVYGLLSPRRQHQIIKALEPN